MYGIEVTPEGLTILSTIDEYGHTIQVVINKP